MSILIWALPVFAVTIGVEWALSLKRPVKGYWIQDWAVNITMGLGNLGLLFATKTVTLTIFFALYQYRFFDLPSDAWWVWLLLIPAEDLCFYWFHRASHEIRLLWAAHVNHHSATSYNLSTALRQSWTSPFMSWVFWLPLVLLGFHPLMIVLAQTFSLLYQYWIHTELIERMGAFGWVFNTPSHHRVHHAANPQYLDRNYGGILIVWDRLFGTFETEQEPVQYGLTTNIGTYNIFVVAFHEWHAMLKDIIEAKSWMGRLWYLIALPGWREDGSGQTSKSIRANALKG